ncbi:MAG: hypothetical protein ACI4WY_12240 [Anaerovoracaceae bacterium]
MKKTTFTTGTMMMEMCMCMNMCMDFDVLFSDPISIPKPVPSSDRQ